MAKRIQSWEVSDAFWEETIRREGISVGEPRNRFQFGSTKWRELEHEQEPSWYSETFEFSKIWLGFQAVRSQLKSKIVSTISKKEAYHERENF